MKPTERLFHPRRKLGRTGFVASRIACGDVADRQIPLADCVATVRRALDAGLNMVDTAPGYEDGYSEQIVGEAVRGRPREELFVIDKIDHHEQPVAPQVEGSLRLLKLEYTDAFLFHGVSRLDVWEKIAAPGGGMDQLGECLKAGKTRFRGISSHHPEVLRAAINSGLCDVAMFAVGPFCDERYVTEILPLAREKNVGTVCFKCFGAGKLVADTTGYNRPLQNRPRGKFSSGGEPSIQAATLPRLSIAECVHYTLACDPDTALLGMSFPNEQDAAFEAALNFKPLTTEQAAEIRRKAVKAVKDKGPCWWNPA